MTGVLLVSILGAIVGLALIAKKLRVRIPSSSCWAGSCWR